MSGAHIRPAVCKLSGTGTAKRGCCPTRLPRGGTRQRPSPRQRTCSTTKSRAILYISCSPCAASTHALAVSVTGMRSQTDANARAALPNGMAARPHRHPSGCGGRGAIAAEALSRPPPSSPPPATDQVIALLAHTPYLRAAAGRTVLFWATAERAMVLVGGETEKWMSAVRRFTLMAHLCGRVHTPTPPVDTGI